ncbi:MAG TPA: hypothetical protein VFI25_09100 [Planctomycetota bacterium]|nr:hypothetical protein [Planctomycetota bacterium]
MTLSGSCVVWEERWAAARVLALDGANVCEPDLAPGAYEVASDHPGHAFPRLKVEVKQGETAVLAVPLR